MNIAKRCSQCNRVFERTAAWHAKHTGMPLYCGGRCESEAKAEAREWDAYARTVAKVTGIDDDEEKVAS